LASAYQIADDLLRRYTEEPAGQVRTMAMIISGFVSLARGVPDQALEYFRRVCDREVHPRFFLDWYWRIVGRLGLSRTWVAKGEWTGAAEESDLALQSAESTADPALRALAWEVKVRISIHEQEWDRGEQCLKNALDALTISAVPYAAWQIHATAAELHRLRGDATLTEHHRGCAAAVVRRLADS